MNLWRGELTRGPRCLQTCSAADPEPPPEAELWSSPTSWLRVRARSAATCPAALQDRVPRPRGVHLVRVGKRGGGTIHHHPGPPPSTSSYQRRGQPPMPRGEGPALLAPSSLSLWEPSETRRPLQPETGTPTWIPEDPGPPPLLPRGTLPVRS